MGGAQIAKRCENSSLFRATRPYKAVLTLALSLTLLRDHVTNLISVGWLSPSIKSAS